MEVDFLGFVIRIRLNIKSQRTRKIEVFSEGTLDSKNLRCETRYIGDYEYVNISSFAVLGIKLWLDEDGDLRSQVLIAVRPTENDSTGCTKMAISQLLFGVANLNFVGRKSK